MLNVPKGCAPWPLQRQPLALETSIPGIFAAGDVREQSIKRVASAVGEGSMAGVLLVHQYLKGKRLQAMQTHPSPEGALMDPGELRRIGILADLPEERLEELARQA